MADYRGRLLERVRQAVADAGVTLEPEHLVREVALFADRTDVAEEVTRLAAHLDQFAELVRTGAEGAGRRLEFVVQEMGRETNTLGSKAGRRDRSPGTWSRSRRRWRRSASWSRTWSDHGSSAIGGRQVDEPTSRR